ncbi:MAG: hypothetical protein QOE02_5565, partial [Rhodospirillaceae bacterium]|nr:hypothetical protein [Rhodospirillaceae bacterium]
ALHIQVPRPRYLRNARHIPRHSVSDATPREDRARRRPAELKTTDTQAPPLRSFAGFLRRERTALTEKWMNAVLGDAGLVEADKLTYDQLADHLPET